MTWNDQRKGWFGRTKKTVLEPTEPVSIPQEIIIPPYPSFSPASIASLLKVYRSNVQYWIQNGKLEAFQDNIGETYVMREELVRFIQEWGRKKK